MYLVNLGALSTVAAFFCPGTLYLARKSFLHASQYFFSFLGGVPADTAYGSIFLSRCAGARKRHETSGHIFHHILYYRIRIFITKRSRAWIHNAGMRGDV